MSEEIIDYTLDSTTAGLRSAHTGDRHSDPKKKKKANSCMRSPQTNAMAW